MTGYSFIRGNHSDHDVDLIACSEVIDNTSYIVTRAGGCFFPENTPVVPPCLYSPIAILPFQLPSSVIYISKLLYNNTNHACIADQQQLDPTPFTNHRYTNR